MARLPHCCLVLALIITSVAVQAEEPASKAKECARECHELYCDTAAVRYGKYCGVGHGGCPDEEPCDEADRCCKVHDECVEQAGVLNNTCHADFIACLDQIMLSGSKGFSKECPYSLVIPTMKNGIELTMMFGSAISAISEGVERRKQQQHQQQQQPTDTTATDIGDFTTAFQKMSDALDAASQQIKALKSKHLKSSQNPDDGVQKMAVS